MGNHQHHAIVITATRFRDTDNVILDIHEEARRRFGHLCSEIINSRVNGYHSFFIAPNGRVVGRIESNQWNAEREDFIRWLRDYETSNEFAFPEWTYVEYGGDYHVSNVIDHVDAHR